MPFWVATGAALVAPDLKRMLRRRGKTKGCRVHNSRGVRVVTSHTNGEIIFCLRSTILNFIRRAPHWPNGHTERALLC